jgi:hypothetical protein
VSTSLHRTWLDLSPLVLAKAISPDPLPYSSWAMLHYSRAMTTYGFFLSQAICIAYTSYSFQPGKIDISAIKRRQRHSLNTRRDHPYHLFARFMSFLARYLFLRSMFTRSTSVTNCVSAFIAFPTFGTHNVESPKSWCTRCGCVVVAC